MHEAGANSRATLPEEVMLARLAQSEQMREFFIEMWKQNPALAKQGGARVQSLLTPVTDKASPDTSAHKQRGVSLIELIMFIVIISIAVTGILRVMNQVTGHSADSLVRKQALAIAESLLEEVELMPFTYCDPNDASAVTATSAVLGGTGCATTVEDIGPEAGETRYAAPNYDNVNDYHGFSMSGVGGIKDITNASISSPALDGYSASVSAVQQALGGIAGTDVNGKPQSLLVTVTVTGPGNTSVVLDGYRTRYAPNDLP